MTDKPSLLARTGRDGGNTVRNGVDIVLRTLAAILGGYALTAAATSLLGVLLTALSLASRTDGAIIATMLSFLVYACAVLWAFAARSARLACGALLTLTGMLVLPLMLTGFLPAFSPQLPTLLLQ